jgi:catechol 2,3-dioxygenase-like lactoylglutathione lyase family enzyme
MKLNHLHLTVNDVPAARAFLERYFGLRPLGEGHKNFDMLLDDDGLVLTLMGVEVCPFARPLTARATPHRPNRPATERHPERGTAPLGAWGLCALRRPDKEGVGFLGVSGWPEGLAQSSPYPINHAVNRQHFAAIRRFGVPRQ